MDDEPTRDDDRGVDPDEPADEAGDESGDVVIVPEPAEADTDV